MNRSLFICLLILIVAAFLGWREARQLSSEKEVYAKLREEASSISSGNARTPKTAAMRMERGMADLALKEKVKALTGDFFGLYRMPPETPAAAFAEERLRIEAELKSRLGELDPAGIKLFMEEFNNNPDLNIQIRQSLDIFVEKVFIAKYPIEMARMMSESPKQFGIGDGRGYDLFSYLIYYYSAQEKDLKIVFECLAESPPEFQSKYIGGALRFGAGSPTQRAELLEEMRNFAITPEQQELVKGQLSELVFGRSDAKGSFIELSEWIGSVNLSPEELVVATKDMQKKVRVGETAQWLDWLAQNEIPDEVSKERAFELATQWTEKDYQAAGKWLNSAPESPEKSAVASAYAAKTHPYDPEGANQWLKTLPQGPDRTRALETIYQGMLKNENFAYDKATVAAFAREHGLNK